MLATTNDKMETRLNNKVCYPMHVHMQYILKNAPININSEIFSIVLTNACVLIKLIYHIPGRIEQIMVGSDIK